MSLYAEYVTGGIKNRNKIYRVGDFKNNGVDIDCYRSIFLFDEGLKHYVDKTGSVKGYAGKHISDALIFDFDGIPIEDVKNSAIDFIQYLESYYEVPIGYIRIAFSGSKGFHITIPFQAICQNPTPSLDFYKVYRGIAEDITEGLKYVDLSIYELRRIIRLANTRHSGSGLYKIPLSFQELQSLSIDEIRELAKQPRKEFEHRLPVSEMSEVDTLKELYEKWFNTKFKQEKENGASHSELLRGVKEGGRSNAAIKLTGYYIKLGMTEGQALEHVKLWNVQNEPSLSEQQLTDIVSGAYSRYAEPIKDNITELFYTPERAYNENYKNYVTAGQRESIKTGFVRIDKLMRGLRSGEVLGLIGKTGNAKSALIQNIGQQYAKRSKRAVVFFSLEMPVVSVIERAFQIETGLSGYEVENETFRLVSGEPSKLTQQVRVVCDALSSFYTIERGGLTIENVKEITRFGEENIYKQKTGLIIIDYLSLLKGAGRDMFEQTARLARELKDASKDLDVPVVFLSQVTKSKSQTDELQLDSGRDSGAIAEGADFIIGLWKIDDNDDAIKYEVGLLKNRRGKVGKVTVLMNKRSLVFKECE